MSQPFPAVNYSRWLIAGAFGYGLLIWLLLPSGVITINDDFGYLRSVVQTLQQGRPWTDDWLEPWAASLSSLGALLFSATGSFSFAIHGLLAAFAVAAFAAMGLLFRQRGFSLKLGAAAALVLLTFPTVLWKTVEFTSVALYLPCLLFALWASAGQRWWLFLVFWALAMAARQSALPWLLIPLWGAAQGAFFSKSERRSRAWAAPAAAAVCGLLFFGVLDRGMNQTHAQEVLTQQAFTHIVPRDALRAFGVGFFVYMVAAGWGAFLLGQSGRVSCGVASRRKIALVALIFAALLLVDERDWARWEHNLVIGSSGWWYLKLVIAISAVGWLRGGFRLRADYALFALGSLVLVCVRGVIWDYYLLEVALFGIFGVTALERSSARDFRSSRWLLGLVAVFHLLFFLDLKCVLDRARALCVISEIALREQKLQPTELSYAPFGFTGWHLYPYYVRHEGKASADLAGFGRYLRSGAVEVGQSYSKVLHVLPQFRHEPPGDRRNLVASGRVRFAWFFHAEFFLLRFKTETEQPADVSLVAAEYHPQSLPLNDAEWRSFIETPLTERRAD
ncbi:MAG: hypothetical protein ABIZ81_08005 [Opitutaceae bacterium]